MEDRGMMGNQSGVQASLLYAFNLEDHVPQNHLLRSIDRLIDLADIRRHLAPFYSSIGRPSIDPELMIRCCWLAISWGSGLSAASVMKSISILPIGGSAA